MPIKKANKAKTIKDGPPKIVLMALLIFFLFVVFYSFAWRPIKRLIEYQRDQTYLASAMKTKLPSTPLSEVQYPAKGYLCPGCCLWGAGAGLMHYLEPDVDFDLFVVYGIPTTFLAEETKLNKRFGPGGDVWRAFDNFGYRAYRGALNPAHPPEIIFPAFDPRNFITFKSKEEEVTFIKKLLSAGNIPIVPLGDFLLVTGYKQDKVWFSTQRETGNLLKYPELLENQPRSYEEWLSLWGNNTPFLDVLYGHTFYWVEKTHSRKTEREILLRNKKAAQEAVSKIQKTIDYLAHVKDLRDYSLEFDVRAMSSLSRYLNKKGYHKLAALYWKIAQIYNKGLNSSAGKPTPQLVRETLIQIKPLAEEAAAIWSEKF